MATTEQYSEELVLRINELFYDLASTNYDHIHDEMGGSEQERWQQAAATYLRHSEPITVADVGTGQGFVPVTLQRYLSARDTLVCSDISTSMLAAARRNLERSAPQCTVRFEKISSDSPLRLPFDDLSADVLTMNSVLHHIKDTGRFLAEIQRVLKPGGLLFIGHEPNKSFRQHGLLMLNYLLMRTLFLPKLTATLFTQKTGLYGLAKKLYYTLRPAKGDAARRLQETINATLIREGLIDTPIALERMSAITDIRDDEGFHPRDVLRDFDILHLDIYNHMLLVSMHYPGHPLVRRYDALLRTLFPEHGGTFFVVARKPQR